MSRESLRMSWNRWNDSSHKNRNILEGKVKMIRQHGVLLTIHFSSLFSIVMTNLSQFKFKDLEKDIPFQNFVAIFNLS
jgi:hypothetical protein